MNTSTFTLKNGMRKILFIVLCIFIVDCDFNNNPKLNFSFPLPSSNSSVSTTQSSPFVGATILESSGSTDIFEGVTKDSYTIVLNSVPKDSVIISVSFDNTQISVNDLTTSPISISFTTANWNIPQTVYVTAIYDNTTEGNHKSSILHTTTDGTDIVTIGTVIANITDNSGSRLTNSLQSGTVTIGGTNPLAVTLTPSVDPAKSYAYCNFRMNNSAANRATTCQIAANGTTIDIQSGNSGGSNSLLATESIQTITLSQSVDLNRSFIIAYSRTANSSSSIDERRTLRYRFLTNSTIEVLRNETGIVTDFEWQVIQLDGARIQSGIATIQNNSTSVSATLSSLNLSNSFIILNSAAGAGVNGVEHDHYVQAYYNSSTQIRFARNGTDDTVDISWYAIEMIDGTTVQSGNTTVSSVSSSAITNLNAVNTGKTMIVFSNQIELGSGGDLTQDSGTFSSVFNNSTTIQFQRAGAESNSAIISWFAVQFQ